VGVGIADVTDRAIWLGMQGMADPDQKTTKVETPLYARAFMINSGDQYIVIVNADIWTGSHAVKAEVLNRLSAAYPFLAESNVLVSGTHTHSGPGGFTDYEMYENVPGGFDPHTFECIVSGMVTAIRNAY